MKFGLTLNMERLDPSEDIREINKRVLEVLRIAEDGGFEVVWAAEHHAVELNAGPDPLAMLAHWAAHTSRIRLGTGVVVAPYWHPVRLASEAALIDVLSDGRLEFGIARGAFQYEFDRMAGGIPQQEGVAYLKEMLPVVKALWAGDYAHDGDHWSFPTATAVPKPLQKPHPPIWVAARDPGTFDWAIKSGANIMATPLSRPNAEVVALGERFEATLANNPGVPRPRFMMLRSTFVYDDPDDWRLPVEMSINFGRQFENLFQNKGDVINGFPEAVDYAVVVGRDNYAPETVHENMVYGTPDEVVEKLGLYREAGVDLFCFGPGGFGMPRAKVLRSLELFIERVMPHFAADEASPHAAAGD